jgi:hypothetical protein
MNPQGRENAGGGRRGTSRDEELGVVTTGERPTRLPSDRMRMVRWLSPRGLFFLALDVVVSGLFGKYADKRELEGAIPEEPFAVEGTSVWIDYIADVGDGWNSTATMAWLLTQEHLTIEPPHEDLMTERGSVLIMGGDEVYPKASEDQYRRRLWNAYAGANGDDPGKGHALFAIPGNHDWYDGLTSFLRTFCQHAHFGNWRTPQKRSYFAVQLPHRWWILGIDIAFDYYLDQAQLTYFDDLRCRKQAHIRSYCDRIHEADRIILCTAKPGWEEAKIRGDFRSVNQTVGRRALYEFEKRITDAPDRDGWGCRLRLVLSGDLHHYAHYVPADERRPQRITAGGGGAFFYPTHAAPTDVPWPSEPQGNDPQEMLHLEKVFPEKSTSRSWWPAIIGAPIFANPSFAFFAGALYLVFGLVVPGSITKPETGVRDLFAPPGARPMFVVMSLLLFLALYGFADARTWWGRLFVVTPIHWAAHLAALSWTVTFANDRITTAFTHHRWSAEPASLAFTGAVAVAVFVIGGLAGGAVMGIYLFLLQLLGRHPNEAFAALHLSRYKNFLRLHLDDRGVLTVYPFGVRRVSKHWQADPSKHGQPFYSPVDRPKVELIERRIEIQP